MLDLENNKSASFEQLEQKEKFPREIIDATRLQLSLAAYKKIT